LIVVITVLIKPLVKVQCTLVYLELFHKTYNFHWSYSARLTLFICFVLLLLQLCVQSMICKNILSETS